MLKGKTNMIKAILACDDEWGIGKNGDLPWPHNPADLRWFKNNTLNSVIVMGKSTWDSLPRKPLPNRENLIVTTSKQEFGYDDYEFINFSDLEVKLSSTKDINNIWIIGGAKLISGLINFIEEFHLSRINGNFNCDTFLPSDLIKEKFILSKTDISDGVNFDIWCKK